MPTFAWAVGEATVVVMVAELFAGVGSTSALWVVTVLDRTVPFAIVVGTLTITVKVRLVVVWVGPEQRSVPPVPTGGATHDQSGCPKPPPRRTSCREAGLG